MYYYFISQRSLWFAVELPVSLCSYEHIACSSSRLHSCAETCRADATHHTLCWVAH